MRRKENELTSREREILKYLRFNRYEIAKMLFIEFSTVATHLHRIYKKLGVKNRYDALFKALDEGIIKQEDIVR